MKLRSFHCEKNPLQQPQRSRKRTLREPPPLRELCLRAIALAVSDGKLRQQVCLREGGGGDAVRCTRLITPIC